MDNDTLGREVLSMIGCTPVQGCAPDMYEADLVAFSTLISTYKVAPLLIK